MAILDWLEPEDLIVNKISDLIPNGMIFIESETSDLDNKIFNDIFNDSEKIGVLVRNAGFTPGSIVGNRGKNNGSVQQKVTQFYQVSIATPRRLYRANVGGMVVAIISRLNGQRLSPSVKVKELADDKQYKNEPIFENNLAFLSLLFEVEFIV